MYDELDSFGRYCFFSTFLGTIYGAVFQSLPWIVLASTFTGLVMSNLYLSQTGGKV